MNFFVSELDVQTRRIDLKAQIEQKGKVGFSSDSTLITTENGFGFAYMESCGGVDAPLCIFNLPLNSPRFASHTYGFGSIGARSPFAGLWSATR
jgi:hypothetical protein